MIFEGLIWKREKGNNLILLLSLSLKFHLPSSSFGWRVVCVWALSPWAKIAQDLLRHCMSTTTTTTTSNPARAAQITKRNPQDETTSMYDVVLLERRGHYVLLTDLSIHIISLGVCVIHQSTVSTEIRALSALLPLRT